MLAEVLGVRIHGTRPVFNLEVPLAPGLMALAGVNGVGKTRVLAGTRQLLAGKSDAGHVLLRITDHDDGEGRLSRLLRRELHLGDPDRRESLVSVVAEGIADVAFGGRWRTYELGTSGDVREVWHDEPVRIVTGDEIARMILSQRGLALIPGKDVFGIWATIDRRNAGPVLRRILDRADESWAGEFDELVDAADDEVTECWHGDPFDNNFEGRYGSPGPCPYDSDLLPTPVKLLASVSMTEWPLTVFDADGDSSVIDLTRELIANMVKTKEDVLGLMAVPFCEEADEDDSSELIESNGALAVAGMLSEVATLWLQRLLPGAGALRCRIAPVQDWLVGTPVRWEAQDSFTEHWIDIVHLGRAHGRWARFSIAATFTNGRPGADMGWFFADEPELALHRSAEGSMGRSLREMTRQFDLNVIIATHSPTILESADRVILVGRDDLDASVTLNEIPSTAKDLAEELGLNPSDLLGWYRSIVLVEGLHDKIVVEGLLGQELTDSRAAVIALGGIKDSSAVFDGQVLTDFSHARLLLVIDGMGPQVEALWKEVRSLDRLGRTAEAVKLLHSELGGDRRYEARFLRTAGERLLSNGSADRLELIALSAPDVLDLLPVDRLVPGADSWQQLRGEFAATGQRGGTDFKIWLRGRKRARLELHHIARATSAMQHLPDEISRIAEALELDHDSTWGSSTGERRMVQ